MSSASAKSGISTFLQLLQFGISVLSLQLFGYFFFSSVSAIWYLRSVSAKIKIKFGVIFCFASAKSGISTVLQLLQFGISVCLCNCFGISSSLQFLQFGIWVKFLQKKKMEWYFVFCLCKIWYFDFPSTSAIWYFCSISAIVLVFLLLFSFCNLVFAFSFCKNKIKFGVIFCLLLLQNLVFWLSFNFCNLIFLFYLCNCFGISSSLQFLQFGIWVKFLQIFLQWYFFFRFCKIWYFDFPSASVTLEIFNIFAS